MKNNWQTVFISGGGSGIGLYLANLLLKQGSDVAIFDLRVNEKVQAELSNLGGKGRYECYEVNVCDADALSQAASQATAQLGAPGLAISCAGIQLANDFLDISEEDFTRVININLLGSRNFSAAVIPHMNEGGQLAFVASLAGLVSNYSYAAYNASKFGVVGLAGALRIECKPKGIGVSVICPPEIVTPMVTEELKTMHPITRDLKAVAGTIELDSACREMIVGLKKQKFYIVPGFKAKCVWKLNQWFPALLRRMTDNVVLKLASQAP